MQATSILLSFFKKFNRRTVKQAFTISFIICFACIFQDSCQTNLFDDTDFFSKLLCKFDKTIDYSDSVLFINTTHAKREVKYCIYEGSTLPEDSVYDFVVDKNLLLRFLHVVDSIGTYKGIIFDITIDERYKKPEIDDSLIYWLKELNTSSKEKKHRGRNKVIFVKPAKNWRWDHVFDKRFEQFASKNDYGTSYCNSQFVRPTLVQQNSYDKNNTYCHPALLIYDATHDNSIEPVQWLPGAYWVNGFLFRNCPPLKIHKVKEDYCAHLYEFLNHPEEADLKDKIIILGDFDNDKHYTYAGELPGPFLIYEMYKAFDNNIYLVEWRYLMLFFLFTLIAYCIIDRSFPNWIYKNISIPFEKGIDYSKNGKVVNWLIKHSSEFILAVLNISINYIGFGVILLLVSVVLYYWCDYLFSSAIPLIIFSIIKFYLTSKKSLKKSKRPKRTKVNHRLVSTLLFCFLFLSPTFCQELEIKEFFNSQMTEIRIGNNYQMKKGNHFSVKDKIYLKYGEGIKYVDIKKRNVRRTFSYSMMAETDKGELSMSIEDWEKRQNSQLTKSGVSQGNDDDYKYSLIYDSIAVKFFPNKRIALLVGNENYNDSCWGDSLTRSKWSTYMVAKKLRSLGFETMVLTDCSNETFNKAIDDFSHAAADYDIKVFYYTGHGFRSNNTDYIVPVDNIKGDSGKTIGVYNDIAAKMHNPNKTKQLCLLCIDACRTDTLIGAMDSVMELGDGTVILYSTGKNKKSWNYNTDEDEFTPFANAFIKNIDARNTRLQSLLLYVVEKVAFNTRNHTQQIPEIEPDIHRMPRYLLRAYLNGINYDYWGGGFSWGLPYKQFGISLHHGWQRKSGFLFEVGISTQFPKSEKIYIYSDKNPFVPTNGYEYLRLNVDATIGYNILKKKEKWSVMPVLQVSNAFLYGTDENGTNKKGKTAYGIFLSPSLRVARFVDKHQKLQPYISIGLEWNPRKNAGSKSFQKLPNENPFKELVGLLQLGVNYKLK